MPKLKLYNVAKTYLNIIDQMERTRDKSKLMDLEEQRVIWHNRLIHVLRREGIPFRDREHITRIAYQVVRESE